MAGHQAGNPLEGAVTVPPSPGAGAPAPLSLRGLSRDGAALLLTDESGAGFVLDITPGLRAALRGDASRTGKLETTMDSTLRPRDIQARIRAGESAEAVAEAAQTSVEKIMAFAGPVLAEREHVAQRAQRSNLRRPAGESSGATRTLGDAVEAHLRSCNVDPGVVAWDAWRREDGRWSLLGDYELTMRSGSAQFTFDARGNYVVLDNEDARWLVGESVASPAPARDDLQTVRERRLTSVPPDELPLGDDAIELVHEDHVAAPPVEPPVEPAVEPAVEEATLPLEAFFEGQDDEPDVGLPVASPAEPDPDPEPAPEPIAEEAAATRRPVQKKKGRASVPSWDEIMFGSGSDDPGTRS
ncbi:MAG: septation protein SepH [Nocardioides sp.]|uniref:septation protein SepH n=2 Tax=Nocardioides sp. TaxID=35761 RepID=UPI00238F8999|nr:septation protein SepH [Nocardioides sp.]MDE0776711.1 septation protein SepH [Nocardioides sp.]